MLKVGCQYRLGMKDLARGGFFPPGEPQTAAGEGEGVDLPGDGAGESVQKAEKPVDVFLGMVLDVEGETGVRSDRGLFRFHEW